MASPRPYLVCAPTLPQRIVDGVYTVDDYVPGIPGRHFPRKMTIVRLGSGDLLFWNAIPLPPDGLAAVAAIGRPAILFVPSSNHCIDARAFADKLALRVLTPAGSRDAITARVRVDGVVADLPPDPALTFVPLDGTHTGEGFLRHTGAEGTTLIVGDLLLNIAHLPGFWGWMWKRMGFTGGPRVGPVWAKRTLHDRPALARQLRALADGPPLARVVPSHGPVVAEGVHDTLRALAASL